MGLRISTNVGALSAVRNLSQTQRQLDKLYSSLSSGEKNQGGSEGAATFAISEGLKSQISGMKAARNNADNASSFIQVAEGGLNEQNNILLRMRELAIQSSSDTFGDTEREMLDSEFQQISKEVERIAQTTSYGRNQLLNGQDKEYEFQVGAYKGEENIIKYTSNTNTTLSALGLDGLTVSEKSDARDAIESIDEALLTINKSRANFGAVQNRLDSTVNHASGQVEALERARSKMADTDVAEAVGEMAKHQALAQYQLAILAQANQFPGQVLKLIA